MRGFGGINQIIHKMTTEQKIDYLCNLLRKAGTHKSLVMPNAILLLQSCKLNNKKVDESLFKNGNLFSIELPNSKRVIEFKLLTHWDEKKVDEILKDYQKVEDLTVVSSELTTRLKYQIQSVDGNNDQKVIDNFVDNEFLALDTRAYRKYMTDISPDIDMTFEYISQTGNKHTLDIPLGIDFFWPAAE